MESDVKKRKQTTSNCSTHSINEHQIVHGTHNIWWLVLRMLTTTENTQHMVASTPIVDYHRKLSMPPTRHTQHMVASTQIVDYHKKLSMPQHCIRLLSQQTEDN